MTTRPRRVFVPRNVVAFALVGHVGGALAFGLAGALFAWSLAFWAAMGGAALGGAFGVLSGLLLLRVEDQRADAAARVALPPRRPWAAIGAGVVASVVVSWVSFSTTFGRSGFLEGSPCQELSSGRGPHIGTVQTLVPLQYTCVYSGGTLATAAAELAVVTTLALLGTVAIGWGLWRLARARPASDTVFRVLAGVVAVFLATVGVAGVGALPTRDVDAQASGAAGLAGTAVVGAAAVAVGLRMSWRLMRTVLRSPYAGGMDPAERQRARTRQHTVVGVVFGALLLVALSAPWILQAVVGAPTVTTSQRPQPMYTSLPEVPPMVAPETLDGFTAPRGAGLSTAFTLDQAIAASQEISDLTVAVAGPINDPNIAPGTTSFPVYAVDCLEAPGKQVDHEVWFTVDDVAGGIDRARTLWESKGYTLDPESTPGRYGYIGDPTGAVDLVSIEDMNGTIKLRVASVCVPTDGS
jgi:hypothetical protein